MSEPFIFTLQSPSGTVYCVGFEDELDLTGLLARRTARGGVTLSQPPTAADWPPRIKPERPRGRPSFEVVIAKAIAALGGALDARENISVRARQVLKHLAESNVDPEQIPKARTVRDYLARKPVGGKGGGKYGEKSRRARIARTGGAKC